MKIRSLVLAMAVLAPISFAQAAAGDFEFKFGVHSVNPKSDNGTLANGAFNVEVDSNVRPTFNLGYWLTENWQIDVLAAIPFKHKVNLNNQHLADLTHLPPTVTLQYHFAPEGSVDPFLGIGLNYTMVYNESTRGAVASSDLSLDNSVGLSAQAGLAFRLNDQWSIGADVRWFDIDSDARLDGADIGTVNVDPIAMGVFAIYRF
jgi:outer membrane protein